MLIFKNADGQTLATMTGQVDVAIYQPPSLDVYFTFNNGVFLNAKISGTEDDVIGIVSQSNANPGNEFLLVIEDPM